MNKHLLIALLVVVGCGEEPKEQPKPVSQPASTQATSTSAPASEPKIKGELYQVESHSTWEDCNKKKKKELTEPPFISFEKIKEGGSIYSCNAKKECEDAPLFVVLGSGEAEYACSGDGKKSDFEKKVVTLTIKDDALTIENMEYALAGQKGKCPEDIGKTFEKNKKKAKCTTQESFTAKKVK